MFCLLDRIFIKFDVSDVFVFLFIFLWHKSVIRGPNDFQILLYWTYSLFQFNFFSEIVQFEIEKNK